MIKEDYFIFTDESCITNPDKPYSAICAMSGSVQFFKSQEQQIKNILGNSTEYKFQKLNKNTKDDLLKLCDKVLFPAINEEKMRIDVLIWNNQQYDKNQENMHYHLLLNVLRKYPKNIKWLYYPDQDIGKNYAEITNIVNTAANSKTPYELTLEQLAAEYMIHYQGELDSKNSKLIQITDVFAGLGAFSYNYYNDYTDWSKNTTGSLSFDFVQPDIENNRKAQKYNNRFILLEAINARCKKYNSHHSINSKHGLHSYGSKYGMNFWLWGNDRSNMLKRGQSC